MKINGDLIIGETGDSLNDTNTLAKQGYTGYFNGSTTSINTLTTNGTWRGYISSGSADANYLGWYGNSIVETFNQSNEQPIIQRITRMIDGRQWIRYCATSALSYSDQLFDCNIITSAFFGENGYIRFTNGFQIAWIYKSATVSGTAWGSLYYSDVAMGNWSISFAASPYFVISNANGLVWMTNIATWSATSAGTVRLFRPTNYENTSVGLRAFAVGRWK